MPPKKAKLHVLAVEVAPKTIIRDASKKIEYTVGKQFATGGFGRIYTCQQVGQSGDLVLKVEPSGNGPLFTEVNIFQRILKLDQIEAFKKEKKLRWLGVPHVISNGIFDYGKEKLRYLIIPKYAVSLESIREKNGLFDHKSVFAVAQCVLNSLEYLHSKCFVHADVKAANILLQKAGDYSTAVLVDYGLARLASSNEDKPDKKRAHNGTAIFTSLDAHRGVYPSYRGDIEILAYNCIYWLTSNLPWLKDESDPEKVYQQKITFSKNIKTNLKTLLKDHSETIAPLEEMFNVASNTNYTAQVDYKRLYKVVDRPFSGSAKKRASNDDGNPTPSRMKKPVEKNVDESSRKTVPVQSSKSAAKSRTTIKKKSIVESESDEDVSDEEEVVVRTRAAPPPTDRMASDRNNRSRARNGTLSRTVLSKKNVDNDIDDQDEEDEKDDEESVEDVEPTPKKKTKAGGTTKVDSATKRSASKLRKVPGMMNLPKGRRSLIISKINKKHNHEDNDD